MKSRLFRTMGLILSVVLLMSLLLLPVQAIGSPNKGAETEVIIFTLGLGEAAEVYSIQPDGSNLRQLTDNSVVDWHPRIAPDGKKIAMCRVEDGIGWLVVMDPNGGNEEYITDQFYCSSAWGWSPDSTRILAPSGYEKVLNKIHLKTGVITPISTDPVLAHHADWSPDGTMVVMDGDPWALWVMDIKTSELTNLGSWYPRIAEWSPDGMQIAFERYIGGLYVINKDGSGARQIPTAGSVFAPTWSPDGTKIAYTTFGSQLRVVTVDGTSDYPVPNMPSGYIENADWGTVKSNPGRNSKSPSSMLGSMGD